MCGLPKAALRKERADQKYLGSGKDVYICFNNDCLGFAPKTRGTAGMLKQDNKLVQLRNKADGSVDG